MGLDVERDAMLEDESRITTHVCNSLVLNQVERVLVDEVGDGLFDLVVDDGLHSELAQAMTLYNLWPFLEVGGIYIIEDVDLVESAEWFQEEILRSGSHATIAVTPGLHNQSVVVATKLGKSQIPFESLTERDTYVKHRPVDFENCWTPPPGREDLAVDMVQTCCSLDDYLVIEGDKSDWTQSEGCFDSYYTYERCCVPIILEWSWGA